MRGLKITNDKEEPVSYFVNIQSGKDEPVQAFYSFCSYGDELYFGSDRGRIWCYSLQNEIFRLWELPVKDKVIAINEIKGTGLLITTIRIQKSVKSIINPIVPNSRQTLSVLFMLTVSRKHGLR
jgi:hypothetical protein